MSRKEEDFERLERINATLLSALEALVLRFDGSEDGDALEFDQARDAILAAKGDA